MNTFSVILTTHKRPLLLRRAIDSVKTQLPGRVQIVLVSDIACDDTYRIASTMLDGSDVYLQRSGQPGPAESRNLGIRCAAGNYVLFLDDDDALSKGFLAKADEYVSDDSIVYTDYYLVRERLEDGAMVPYSLENKTLGSHETDRIHIKNFIPPACLVYPIAAVRDRTVDSTLVLNEDWDFILNAMTTYPLRHVPFFGPIVYSREQPDNRGRKNDHLLIETYQRIYKRWPAPTAALKEARQTFFAGIGIESRLADL